MDDLLAEIRACTVCAAHLPYPPKPVFQLHPKARIAIVGQAPGVRAHNAGTPFLDPSGIRLREWLGVDEAAFYNPLNFAVAPAGLCFPGHDKNGGDKPPRKECAPLWQDRIHAHLTEIRLTILPGASAQAVHLGKRRKASLTETVRAWRDYAPAHFPLPHPSWRNSGWLKKNPWFADAVLPALKSSVAEALTP